MASIDYRRLRSQVSMRQVLQLLNYTPLRTKGDQWRGACPLPTCPNTRPDCFSVNVTKNAYQCFVCRSRGNQLDLWAAAVQLPLRKVAENLCGRLGITVPLNPSRPQLENRLSPNHHFRNHW